MQNDIEKIIKDGVLAPSGENAQPWRFIVEDNKIHIFNKPEVDQSLYNFKQRGSYIAHGALIENITISSSRYGYKTNIKLFPEEATANLVAILTLEKAGTEEDSLYKHIENRHTNRKSYDGRKLSNEQKAQLINTVKEIDSVELEIIDETKSLNILGEALAVNELILFSNKKLHDFFYDHILWKEDDQDKAKGFYVKTLEFLPHQLKAVKLFKSWFLLNIFNKLIKVANKIAKENAEKYTKSGTLIAVIVNGNSNSDFIRKGRAMQRVWLKATELGLSMHPCTGTVFLMDRIKGGDNKSFSTVHIDIIKNAYNNISKIFNTDKKSAPLLFRIGYADTPSAWSLRLNPDIVYK
jgi:nitroreductase